MYYFPYSQLCFCYIFVVDSCFFSFKSILFNQKLSIILKATQTAAFVLY